MLDFLDSDNNVSVDHVEKDGHYEYNMYIKPKVTQTANQLKEIISINTTDGFPYVNVAKDVEIRKNPKHIEPEVLVHSDVFTLKFKINDIVIDRPPVIMMDRSKLVVKENSVKEEAPSQE